MIVLGIDPGTRRVGYGLVKRVGGKIVFLAAGLLRIKSKDDTGALFEIKQEIDKLIRKFRPEILATEKLFFMKNQTTGLQVAQARGVILLSGREAGLHIREYGPNEIKTSLTGYGLADKKAVLKMVRLILGKPGLEVIDDASDALGIAIVATQRIAQ